MKDIDDNSYLCIHCGKEKKGAWTPCPSCNYVPKEKTELAKSTLLSDHYLTQAELKAVSGKIKNGEVIGYDKRKLVELVATLDDHPNANNHSGIFPIGCDIRVWLVVLFILIVIFIVLGNIL